ncbi:hypothetical protein SAY86_009897 [Trapa natans]|uniref:Uncharacterized protein n=1 Tax=Trapa natans TaxID=22666 RepID=A0AAN7QQM8_TRANT|nr:hypothetical protein SAY86_009897 [Trapa natans]
MKELVMKRQKEREEIYKGMHMDVDGDSARKTLTSLIDSGTVVLSDLLANMDDQIEQKRLQEQLATEQEAIYGSRPSTKKPLGLSVNANNLPSTPGHCGATPGRYGLSSGKERRRVSGRANGMIPINYVALPKDETNTRGN